MPEDLQIPRLETVDYEPLWTDPGFANRVPNRAWNEPLAIGALVNLLAQTEKILCLIEAEPGSL